MPKPILLAIDDDTSVLEAVVQDLRRHYGQDYRIVRAASGAAALDICRQLSERKDTVALFLSDQRTPTTRIPSNGGLYPSFQLPSRSSSTG